MRVATKCRKSFVISQNVTCDARDFSRSVVSGPGSTWLLIGARIRFTRFLQFRELSIIILRRLTRSEVRRNENDGRLNNCPLAANR